MKSKSRNVALVMVVVVVVFVWATLVDLLGKKKQKKVPQRGLGVAQLEKIRLEEQQKKVNASSGSSSSSLLDVQMEPPSNQTYYDNYTYDSPVWIQEEKVI
jgi:flagellar basal body-associated protein FliL